MPHHECVRQRRDEEKLTMTSPQEQFAELTRRTQENFKHLWEQWSSRSNELMKGLGSRGRSAGEAPGNAEEVLDAVFDFAENLIAQQRAFAKQMLSAASRGQQAVADVAGTSGLPTGPTTEAASGASSPTTPTGSPTSATGG
jgi:hypothetical protein